MNTKKDLIFPVLVVAAVLASILFVPSCANTTQAPTGGAKDTIPPVIVKLDPVQYSCNVPTTGVEFSITFDEYFTIKDANGIVLSPPVNKAPKTKIKGKTLSISYETELKPNTTYVLDLIGAIADNNEGNVFPGYAYVFSTGDVIDSMMVTGSVLDCNTLDPVGGATILLYKDHADSAVFLNQPFATTKTDSWGFFSLRNIPDTLYRIYAITDDLSNNIYDPDTDLIAFMDSLVRPTQVVNDTIFELKKFDEKDTVNCMARKPELELKLFRERPSRQFIRNSGRSSDRRAFVSFNARDAHIDTMWIRGISADRLITQINPERDSLDIWVNDSRIMPDTLMLYVNYQKTDSTGVLLPFTEELKLVNPRPREGRRNRNREITKEDTVCTYTITVSPETVEQYGFVIEFTNPIVYENFDSLVFHSRNPRQREEIEEFTVVPDSSDIRKYSIMPKNPLQKGYEYFLTSPRGAFIDIAGNPSDSTQVKVSLPTNEKLSTLSLNFTNVDRKYIIDFMNENRDDIIRSYTIEENKVLTFPYLAAGKYVVRITEDANKNGIIDTGNLLARKQPESVQFFKINDSYLIEVPEMVELYQDVDMSVLFNEVYE